MAPIHLRDSHLWSYVKRTRIRLGRLIVPNADEGVPLKFLLIGFLAHSVVASKLVYSGKFAAYSNTLSRCSDHRVLAAAHRLHTRYFILVNGTIQPNIHILHHLLLGGTLPPVIYSFFYCVSAEKNDVSVIG